MQAITVGRFEKDPTAQGVIKPADDSWQLVIDKDGYPHLWIRCNLEGEDVGGKTTGLLCIEDLLPPEMGSIPDIMKSTFGGSPETQEEYDACYAEHMAKIEATGRPCPR